jgi:hypothetical protein
MEVGFLSGDRVRYRKELGYGLPIDGTGYVHGVFKIGRKYWLRALMDDGKIVETPVRYWEVVHDVTDEREPA